MFNYNYKFIIVLSVLSLLFLLDLPVLGGQWSRARRSYHAAISEMDSLNSALKQFEKIIEIDSLYPSRARAYIGSLTALKGKHARMPWSKVKWVKRGLSLLDQAVEESPRDPEIRFIRGSTCFYLPSFFKRKQQAIADFKTVVDLLPHPDVDTAPGVFKNMLRFIAENIELTAEEQKKIDRLIGEFSANER